MKKELPKKISKKSQSEKKALPKERTELLKMLNEKRLTLRDIRFGTAGSKNKNVKEQRNIKKDIARINTLLKTQ
jgi:ribosomal protein L29